MKRFCIIIACALAASACSAQGIIGRIGGAGRSLLGRTEATVGTVMLMAPAHDIAGRELVLLLDTTLQQRLGCYALDRADSGRVVIGATMIVYGYDGSIVDLGDLQCQGVSRMRVRDEGNPSRRDFLVTHSLPVVAYALRHYPMAAGRLLTRAQLAPLAAELDTMRSMLVAVGSLDPEPAPVVCADTEDLQAEVVARQAATDRAERLSAQVRECEVALHVSRTYLEAAGSELGIGGVRAVDSYLRDH